MWSFEITYFRTCGQDKFQIIPLLQMQSNTNLRRSYEKELLKEKLKIKLHQLLILQTYFGNKVKTKLSATEFSENTASIPNYW